MREEPRVQQVAHPTHGGKRLFPRGGFTLIELTVSVGLLVVVLLIASTIFRVSIESHRIATANAEIMQKLRAITQQLNADFSGLRKDGEIAVAWVARKVNTTYPAGDPRADLDIDDPDGYVRMDRIMFFTAGDFQSYKANPPVRGNLARVCYQLARDADDDKPGGQKRSRRMLTRTQHILTDEGGLDPFPNVATTNMSTPMWRSWNNTYEYDVISLDAWKYLPLAAKLNMLTVIMDVTVGTSAIAESVRGVRIDKRDSATLHNLLCEGVGEFSVQGWHDGQGRWVPSVDPDGNGSLADSDFFLSGGSPDPNNVPGLLYPNPPYGSLTMDGTLGAYPASRVSEAYFNEIPGLGRALKFTFTLYDSKGVLPKGRTFTHIVYLDD